MNKISTFYATPQDSNLLSVGWQSTEHCFIDVEARRWVVGPLHQSSSLQPSGVARKIGVAISIESAGSCVYGIQAIAYNRQGNAFAVIKLGSEINAFDIFSFDISDRLFQIDTKIRLMITPSYPKSDPSILRGTYVSMSM